MSHRFPVALGTSFHSFLARLAMIPIACLFGEYQTPHTEPYTDGIHDGRDGQTRCALGQLHRTLLRRGAASIARPSAGTLEEPAVQTIPPSALLCQCLGHARRSSPVHAAKAHWKLKACLRGRACTPCLTFLFTCLVSCPSSPSCPCPIWVRVVSCQPKSMALPSTHDGMA